MLLSFFLVNLIGQPAEVWLEEGGRFPGSCSVRQALTYHLDITSPPSMLLIKLILSMADDLEVRIVIILATLVTKSKTQLQVSFGR